MRGKKRNNTEWIPFGSLHVDPAYQRGVVRARVTYLAKNWNDDNVGILTVSVRDGKSWVVDGQHRFLAAMEIGLDQQKVLCHVHTDLTREEEAKLFARLNDQRAPTAYDLFKAGLMYGDKVAIGVEKAARKHGYAVTGQSATGKIACVSKLMEIQRKDPALLDGVLQVTSQAWGDHRAGVEAPMVGGIAKVLDRYNGDVDRIQLAKKLKKQADPAAMLGHAKSRRAMTGGSVTDEIAESVVAVYNKGRRTKALKI